jgi:nicotinate-nucleotide pyrophosphorylase (carboxylating)
VDGAAELPGPEAIAGDVARALAEDVGDGDRTADLIPADRHFETRVECREDAILAGRPWFDETFRQLDPAIAIRWRARDGDALCAGQEVCRLAGPAGTILTGERTALNFLQTLSATATQARAYADAVRGTGVEVLDTRKTIPGLRRAQKYAVRCGGASNHRLGLFDAMLIKENHIGAAGSITAAVHQARTAHPGLSLEVEVEDLEQLDEACRAGADRALLDNFGLDGLREAVARHGGRIVLEASGGIGLDTVRQVAETGVDCVSVGSLTKHLRAVDFSMRYR